MDILTSEIAVAVVIGSELLALYLIRRIWQSSDFLFLKIAMSLIALIPIFGPLLTLWIGNFPSPVARIHQDQLPLSANFYQRWRRVFDEKGPIRRFHVWRELVTRHRNEDP